MAGPRYSICSGPCILRRRIVDGLLREGKGVRQVYASGQAGDLSLVICVSCTRCFFIAFRNRLFGIFKKTFVFRCVSN